MKHKVGLVIDLGNSGTRVVMLNGKNNILMGMSNNFATLPQGYTIATSYLKGNDSTFFEVGGVYYGNGKIVEREFKNKEIRPSSLEAKSSQLASTLSLNLILIKAYKRLADLYNVKPTDLDITFTVTILVPPLELEQLGGEEAIKNLVNKVRKVSYLDNREEKFVTVNLREIELNNIAVDNEAVAAFFGASFYEEGVTYLQKVDSDVEFEIIRPNVTADKLREVQENLQFQRGYTMVIDIGAGTTDVAIFKDMELIVNSRDTFKIGGNSVLSFIEQQVRGKFLFLPESAQYIVETGILEEGIEKHDVVDIVNLAKEDFASRLMPFIRSYLERMSIELPLMRGVLVSGGGSLETRRTSSFERITKATEESEIEVVSPAMSIFLMEFLKKLAPNIKEVSTGGKSTRLLNIEGAAILHKMSN